VADYLPKFDADDAFTLTASATITGGQLVTAGGAVAGANENKWVGVAGHDATTGQPVTVFTGYMQRLTAAGALAANTLVKCAASGQITGYTSGTDNADTLVGITVEAASGAGSVIAVRMAR
jgi:hypothetical protein